MYTITDFHLKLKTARLYRGYKRQIDLCQVMNICKQTWSTWEKGILPNAPFIIDICNCLKISPLYFFTDGVEGIENFDNLYNKAENISLPYIQTAIVKNVKKVLNLALKTPRVYLVEVFAGTGVSRALFELQRKMTRAVREQLIIFDNIQITDIVTILSTVRENPESAVIILATGTIINHLKAGFDDYKLIEIPGMQYTDFVAIIDKALPQLDIGLKGLIITETRFSLTRLALLVKKLQQAQIDKNWEMTFDSVMELCDQVNKYYAMLKGA